MTAPPCSLNREIGWSGHTVSGGVSGSTEAAEDALHYFTGLHVQRHEDEQKGSSP